MSDLAIVMNLHWIDSYQLFSKWRTIHSILSTICDHFNDFFFKVSLNQLKDCKKQLVLWNIPDSVLIPYFLGVEGPMASARPLYLRALYKINNGVSVNKVE